MKKLIFVVGVLVAINAISEPQSKKENINELMQLLDMDAVIDSMYEQTELMLKNMGREMNVQPEEQALFDDYFSEMMNVFREDFSWEKMEPSMTALYDQTFTDSEVADMLAFYKTETGRSVINKMPQVMSQSLQISNQMATTAMPKLQALSSELEMKLAARRALKR